MYFFSFHLIAFHELCICHKTFDENKIYYILNTLCYLILLLNYFSNIVLHLYYFEIIISKKK